MKERTQTPVRCNNSDHSILNINPASHNWVPYFFRCNFSTHLVNINPIIGEVFLTKELVYFHVFKAGGSTIQNGLEKLIKQKQLINFTLYVGTDHYIFSGADTG
eukprot:215538_1